MNTYLKGIIMNCKEAVYSSTCLSSQYLVADELRPAIAVYQDPRLKQRRNTTQRLGANIRNLHMSYRAHV